MNGANEVPEFSRPVRVHEAGREGRHTIAADAAERERLAARFDLIALDRLEAQLDVVKVAAGFRVTGTVTADVVQRCVVTDGPVPLTIAEPVALLFTDVPVADHAPDEEIELGGEALDTLPIESGAIDLGEAAAQTVALALPLFPRSAAADTAAHAAGVKSDAEPSDGSDGPFAALKALRTPKD